MDPSRARCFHRVAVTAMLMLSLRVGGFEPERYAHSLSPEKISSAGSRRG